METKCFRTNNNNLQISMLWINSTYFAGFCCFFFFFRVANLCTPPVIHSGKKFMNLNRQKVRAKSFYVCEWIECHTLVSLNWLIFDKFALFNRLNATLNSIQVQNHNLQFTRNTYVLYHLEQFRVIHMMNQIHGGNT